MRTECIIWSGSIGNDGYARAYSKTLRNMTSAARVIWEEVKGPVPEGYQVDHTCSNPRCVNLEHLQLLTPYENNSQGHRKLTKEQVREIRQRLGTCTKAQLAREFNVSFMTITYIEREKTWKEV